MRDRKAIKKELTDAFISHPVIIAQYELLPGLTFEDQFSLASVENVWFDNLSFVIYNHELIVTQNALNSRPHNLSWYKEKCLDFHDGFELIWLNGVYQYDASAPETSKIIDQVAVLESNDGELVVKVATNNDGVIEPLTEEQLIRFQNYISLIKDAGNRIIVVNQPADSLKLTLNVYVDVSIIDLETGKLLDVQEEVYPVKDAVEAYLENLEFNGAFVKEFFKNTLSQAKGVKLPLIDSAQWKYAAFEWSDFGEWKVPEAGYFKINPEDLTINYLSYELV